MARIAVLGAGAMGSRMARNLADAGHAVVAWNRTPARLEPLVRAGIEAAATPREAADGADAVLAMVRDVEASEAVWCAPEVGALHGLSPRALALECGTVTPEWARALAARVTVTGAGFVDAPVVGTLPQVEARQLVALTGGEPRDVERARPVVVGFGARLEHVGPVGSGATVKLAVNALYAAQVAAVAELLGAVGRSGTDVRRAAEVLDGLAVASPALRAAMALMLAGDTPPQFPVQLVEKDLGYLRDAASACQAYVPVATAVHRVFADAMEHGLGARNITAVGGRYPLS